MSNSVDVLAVMTLAYRHLNGGSDCLSAKEQHEAFEGMKGAIAAVAGLIQIATEFSDYVAADHSDTSLLDREDMWDRLGSAVSRVKGA